VENTTLKSIKMARWVVAVLVLSALLSACGSQPLNVP